MLFRGKDVPPAEPDRQTALDVEVIARAGRLVQAAMNDPERTRWRDAANVPLVDLCLDLRAVLVVSPAGRAVLNGLIPGQDGGDPVGREIARLQAEVARLKTERDEAVGGLQDAADFDEMLARHMPESWDGEEAFPAIALEFVAVLAARVAALGGTLEKHHERPDGSVFPDARTDPNGYRDAVEEFRARGCRCRAFGDGTPEHSPSFLCKPDGTVTPPVAARADDTSDQQQAGRGTGEDQ